MATGPVDRNAMRHIAIIMAIVSPKKKEELERQFKINPEVNAKLDAFMKAEPGLIRELSYKSFETRIGYWVAMRNPDCWHPLQALRSRIPYEELAKKGRGGIG